MMTVLFYIVPMFFIFIFANYTRWQIIDEDDGPGWKKSDTQWHKMGLIMRVAFFVAMLGWLIPEEVDWKHAIVLAPILAIEWDVCINLLRGRPVFAVGEGGWDSKIKNLKWVLYAVWLLASIITYIIL